MLRRGWIPTAGRGSLPFSLVEGESLTAMAVDAFVDAEIETHDFDVTIATIRDLGATLVIHDPLCPRIEAEFLVAAADLAEATSHVVVGVGPVADTIKRQQGELVAETVDREQLKALLSPIVIPGQLVAELPDFDVESVDFASLVQALGGRLPITQLDAPPGTIRIKQASDLGMLGHAVALP